MNIYELQTYAKCAKKWKYRYASGLRSARAPESPTFGRQLRDAVMARLLRCESYQVDELTHYGAAANQIYGKWLQYQKNNIWQTDERAILGCVSPWHPIAPTPVTIPVWRYCSHHNAEQPYVMMHILTTSSDYAHTVHEIGSPLHVQCNHSLQLWAAVATSSWPVVCNVVRLPAIKPLIATPAEKRRYTKDGVLYSSQRSTDESVSEFAERVATWYDDSSPGKYFAQIKPAITRERATELMSDLHRKVALADCSPVLPNTSACVQYGRVCDYYRMCALGETSIEAAGLVAGTPTESWKYAPKDDDDDDLPY